MFKNVIIIIVLSIAWTVYKNQQQASQQQTQQVATIEDKKLAAAKANVDLNRGLPTMLDSQTMLTRVEAESNLTTYHIKMINYPSAYLDQDFFARAQETIGRRQCANSDVKWSYDQGISMKYIVSGSDNQQAGSFLISKTYCERFR